MENYALRDDTILIVALGDGPTQHWSSGNLSVVNDVGSILIGWMMKYADQTGSSVSISYISGSYVYYGNNQWKLRSGWFD